MSRITYKQGDIFTEFETCNYDAFIQQCNCVSGENVAGLAYYTLKRYPEFKKVLKYPKFGDTMFESTNFGELVGLFSQYYPGSPTDRGCGKVFPYCYLIDDLSTRLHALKVALTKYINSIVFLEKEKHIKILSPLIASGLGRSNAKLYENMSDMEYFIGVIKPNLIEVLKEFSNVELTVVYL